MKALVIVLLAALLVTGGRAVPALASSSASTATAPSSAAGGTRGDSTSTPATQDGAPTGHEAPAASPHTAEVQKILGMRASTVIFAAAVLFFIAVLFAAEISRRTPRYRRSDIDPRQ